LFVIGRGTGRDRPVVEDLAQVLLLLVAQGFASRVSRWKPGNNTLRSQGARSARPRCRSQFSIRPNPLSNPPNCRSTRLPAALKRRSRWITRRKALRHKQQQNRC
jgi:hypothetical protein